MSTATRRSLLGGAAVLAATPAALAAAPASIAATADAELLRLGALLVGAWACENQAWALAEGENDDEGPNTLAADAATAVTREIVDRIEALPALTLGGLMVKMRAVLWCRGGDPVTIADLDSQPDPSTDMRLLVGLLQDLTTIGSMAA